MAFPSLAEIQATPAVNTEAAPAAAPETQASSPEPTSPVENGADPETETQAASASEDTSTPAVEQQDATEPAANSGKDQIPYTRFKEKVDQVNTLKEMNELLQQQIAQAQAGKATEETSEAATEVDPLLEKINSLDEYESDSDMVGVMKEMAAELQALRAQSSKSAESVQEIQVNKQVQKIEAKIESVTSEGVHDKGAARVFILQNLSQNPKLEVADLAKQFGDWEKAQEDAILKRLGVSRPDAVKTASASDSPDVPPRPTNKGSASGSTEPSAPKAAVTLRDMRKKFAAGRRR
jgi:hypothetical protein